LQFKIKTTSTTLTAIRIANYGTTKRAQEVKFRINFQSVDAPTRIWLKDMSVRLEAQQTDLGVPVELFETDAQRKLYADILKDGTSHQIVYPHPSKWNVDNYGDGDGGEIPNDIENDDEGEGTEQG